MFDVLDRPLLWITVRWPGLKPSGPDGTGVAEPVENEIEILVELKDADGVKILADPDEEQAKTPKLEAFLLFVSDWRKIKSGGTPLPFSSENADLLIKRQLPFFDAFRLAYVNAMLGRIETREGNSDASPQDGQAAGAESATTGNRKRRRTAAASGSTPPR